jgi:heme transporter 1
MEPSHTCFKLRVGFAVTGILVGLSIAITFGLVYNNTDTAIWGLMSGIFASFALGVHLKYAKDRWSSGHDKLKYLMFLGCLGQLAGVSAFVTYLALAITEQQALTPFGPRGYYLSSVWSMMTWKWSFLLYMYSRTYKRLFEEFSRTKLPVGTNENGGYEKI